MRAVLLGLLAAALLASESAAEPETQSANFMFPYCQRFIYDQSPQPPPPTEALWRGLCAGNIQGLPFLSYLLPANLKSCIPDNVTLEQMVRVVIAYIERRPQRMHEAFNSLAVEALHEAFPCR